MKAWIPMLLAAVVLQAPAVAKEQPPVGEPPKDFKLTETTRWSLENGLDVTFVQYGNTPKVTLRLVTDTGNIDDNGKDAVSDISYQLLTEGTTSKTALEIAQQAANMGGEVSTSVTMNYSYIETNVLSEYVGDAASLVADLALNARFQQADLDRSVTNFVRNLKVSKSRPQGQAEQAFFHSVYGEHPYGSYYADEEKVQALTLDDIKAFLAENLVAKRSHLYISGQFDEGLARKAIESAFADMTAGSIRALPAAQVKAEAQLVFIDRQDAPQSTLRLGLPVVDPSHPDYVGLSTMNTLLGGSFSSRITSNIREDKGYTYSPRSSINAYIDSAVWYQGADVTAEATGPALAEIIKEITRLQTEAPAADELQGFKNYISGIYVLQNSSRTAIINQLWFMQRHGLPASHLETYVKRVNALTPEQISALAKQYLTLDKMTLVVVGDPATKAQLAEVPELKSVYGL